MASVKQLTGGTKDVNPQSMNCTLPIKAGANGVCQMVEVALPVQRLNNRNRSMVMEVLGIQVVNTGKENHHYTVGIATSKPSTATDVIPRLIDANVFWLMRGYGDSIEKSANATAINDLTDKAGHGILLGADKIYAFSYSNAVNAYEVDFRIYYRWKNVSLTEYIGIVQSTQL